MINNANAALAGTMRKESKDAATKNKIPHFNPSSFVIRNTKNPLIRVSNLSIPIGNVENKSRTTHTARLMPLKARLNEVFFVFVLSFAMIIFMRLTFYLAYYLRRRVYSLN